MAAPSNEELVSAFETELLTAYAAYALAALVVYEHLFTFKYEVDFLFRRKWNASAWIFVFNRYFLLANVMFTSAPISQQLCQLTSGLAFTTLRVFAILPQHSWRHTTACILATLACAAFASESYVNFTQAWVYVNDPVLGSSCFGSIPPDAVGIVNRVTVAVAIIAIVLNGLAFVITAAKTASQVQRAFSIGLGTTLSQILLRDGSMFFLATLIVSIINSLPTFHSGSLLNGAAGSIIVPIISIIPHILLSRFIINLRQVHTPTTSSSADQHPSRLSMPNFCIPTSDEIIGNLGEPLEFVDYRIDDEDDVRDGGAEADVSANLDMDMEGQGEGAEGMFDSGRGWVDLEAGPSGSVREVVEADEQAIDVQLEELRLSPVPSV